MGEVRTYKGWTCGELYHMYALMAFGIGIGVT